MSCRIILFSDIHEEAVFSAGAWKDKRLIGWLNSRVMRGKTFDRSRTDRAVRFILENKPDIVVFPGDAVSTSAPEEFDTAWRRLRPLAESGIPLIFTPGNHDIYTRDRACLAALEDFYRKMNGGRAYDPEPYLLEVKGVRFAAVHCAKPVPWVMSSGRMTKSTTAFLRRAAEDASSAPLVCVGHFPILIDHPIRESRRRVFGAGEAAEMIRSGKIALSLCGHMHHGYEKTDARGYGEVCAGSLTRYGSLVVITCREDTGTFELKREMIV